MGLFRQSTKIDKENLRWGYSVTINSKNYGSQHRPILVQIWISGSDMDFCFRYGFLVQIRISGSDMDFWFRYVFLVPIWISGSDMYFWLRYGFLVQIWISLSDMDFWFRYEFLVQVQIWLSGSDMNFWFRCGFPVQDLPRKTATFFENRAPSAHELPLLGTLVPKSGRPPTLTEKCWSHLRKITHLRFSDFLFTEKCNFY